MGTILKKRLVGVEGGSVRGVSVFNLTDIQGEADEILEHARRELDRARAEADAIVQRAKDQGDQIKDAARTQGHREGYEQGLPEGRTSGAEQALDEKRKEFGDQTCQLRSTLANLLTQFDNNRHTLISRAHQELLALALAIAGKVIHQRIEYDPEIVIGTLKAAVDLVASRTAVQVRINPTDLDRLNRFDPQLAQTCLGLRDSTFIPDENIEPGGCLMETKNGQIDGQISTQVDTIVRHIAPAMTDKIESWQHDGPGEDTATASDDRSRQTLREKDEKQ